MTKQLLTFSKDGEPVKAPLTLGPLLGDSCTFAAQGATVRCALEVPDDLWPVEGDAGQLGQVVHNLVLNAVQAMPGGGVVVVRARNQMVGSPPAVPVTPGRYVAISVEDEGPGIPPEDVPRIFDLYFSTKDTGHGLGLATAHSIVSRHGGHLTVDSVVGRGSTFTFWVPASEYAADVLEKRRCAEPGGCGRVLVMDDEPAVRAVAEACLKHLGYDVTLTVDGAEAVRSYASAREEGRPYDAVLLDLTVPGAMGGLEALGYLLRLDPGVRGIVSSGYANGPILADYRAHGFVAALPKPYRLSELAHTLETVLCPSETKKGHEADAP